MKILMIPKMNLMKIPNMILMKIPKMNPEMILMMILMKIPKMILMKIPKMNPEKIPKMNPEKILIKIPKMNPEKILIKIPKMNPEKILMTILKKNPEKILMMIPKDQHHSRSSRSRIDRKYTLTLLRAEKILHREKRTSSACLFYRKISMSPVLPRVRGRQKVSMRRVFAGTIVVGSQAGPVYSNSIVYVRPISLDHSAFVIWANFIFFSSQRIYIAIRTTRASRESELVLRARPAILRSEKSSYIHGKMPRSIYEYIIIYGPPRRSRALAPRRRSALGEYTARAVAAKKGPNLERATTRNVPRRAQHAFKYTRAQYAHGKRVSRPITSRRICSARQIHHKTVHEGQKDYLCDVCPKAFKSKQSLTLHLRSSHQGKKDYLCDVCPKAFTSKQNLTFHVRLIHEGRKDHLITSCNLGCRILSRYSKSRGFTICSAAAKHERESRSAAISYEMQACSQNNEENTSEKERHTVCACGDLLRLRESAKREERIRTNAKSARKKREREKDSNNNNNNNEW
ncbi:unnamed protein product [Trichogramma brassicae]|uniref:C2H2-type domain-containing protein n=1 Tax=Trichogramma brassicae TaxID=86971 RepID=A0A6H5I043_9HYME|nr:unnamed protein product [Trichogramma brassicae]